MIYQEVVDVDIARIYRRERGDGLAGVDLELTMHDGSIVTKYVSLP